MSLLVVVVEDVVAVVAVEDVEARKNDERGGSFESVRNQQIFYWMMWFDWWSMLL